MKKTNEQKKIYLVRHGTPQLPGQEKYYLGRTDLPLSEQGWRQADWLRDFFQEKIAQQEIIQIFHSPLKRCTETAKRIAGGTVPCYAVADFIEISMGEWEMQPISQIRLLQGEAYQLRGQELDTFCPPGGENFLHCQQRSIKALQQIAETQGEGKTSIIVAHAGVNRCILSWIQQQPLRQLLCFTQPYGCITELLLFQQSWMIGQQILCPL